MSKVSIKSFRVLKDGTIEVKEEKEIGLNSNRSETKGSNRIKKVTKESK